MTVTLNIENDAELRAYVKDCIKGQVLSIVRDEFIEIVKVELERKLKGFSGANFDNLVRYATVQAIQEILISQGVSRWSDEITMPIIEAKVNEAIAHKNWNEIVSQLAKRKIESLL